MADPPTKATVMGLETRIFIANDDDTLQQMGQFHHALDLQTFEGDALDFMFSLPKPPEESFGVQLGEGRLGAFGK